MYIWFNNKLEDEGMYDEEERDHQNPVNVNHEKDEDILEEMMKNCGIGIGEEEEKAKQLEKMSELGKSEKVLFQIILRTKDNKIISLKYNSNETLADFLPLVKRSKKYIQFDVLVNDDIFDL